MSPTPVLHGALRLTDWGVIRALGEDARKFLHGQLTQDVEHLQPDGARLAGHCSAKGRLLATFVMWSPAADEVLLACSADVLPAVLKRLSMFVLRAKCKLSDASAELPLWGVAGPLPTPDLKPGLDRAWQYARDGETQTIRLPDATLPGAAGLTPVSPVLPVSRYLRVGSVAPDLPALDADTWLGLEVHSGVGRIVAATVEQFVPQMINLELVGGVNFQKGCYPGQEIVARSQYRGTLKRRAYVLASETPLVPGREIFHSSDAEQPAGMVVLAGQVAGMAPVALVELKIATLAGGSLHAGAASGPSLTPLELPYSFPAEAA